MLFFRSCLPWSEKIIIPVDVITTVEDSIAFDDIEISAANRRLQRKSVLVRFKCMQLFWLVNLNTISH